jgi:hypothetical protein
MGQLLPPNCGDKKWEARMVQSTDSPCFELVSWTDLLEKAGHDLLELELHVNSYSLLNCICTLNHIPDWISADPGYEHLSARVEEIKRTKRRNGSAALQSRKAFLPKEGFTYD